MGVGRHAVKTTSAFQWEGGPFDFRTGFHLLDVGLKPTGGWSWRELSCSAEGPVFAPEGE